MVTSLPQIYSLASIWRQVCAVLMLPMLSDISYFQCSDYELVVIRCFVFGKVRNHGHGHRVYILAVFGEIVLKRK